MQNGKLCNQDGEIGMKEFCSIMMNEIRLYTQSKLADNIFTEYKTTQDVEFSTVRFLPLPRWHFVSFCTSFCVRDNISLPHNLCLALPKISYVQVMVEVVVHPLIHMFETVAYGEGPRQFP